MKSRVLWIWLVLGTVWMVLVIAAAARGDGYLGGWRIGAGVGIGGGCSSGYCPSYGCPGGICPTSPPRLPASPPRPAAPATWEAPRPSPTVVRVHSTRGAFQKQGSGSMIGWNDGRGLVVSVAHILQAGWSPAVIFSDGTSLPARIVATDALHDCALLEIQTPKRPCIGLAATPPRSGPVYWAGYGPGAYQVGSGQVIAIDGDFLKARGKPREGDSGGPIYGPDGRLVAIISEGTQVGREPWNASGPHVGWLREWIAKCRTPPVQAPGQEPVNTPPLVAVPDDQPTPSAELADIRAELAALRKVIAELELKPGPPGPAGPPGPPAVVPPVEPWYLRTVNPATGEERITEIYPGDTVTLRLFEYPKP